MQGLQGKRRSITADFIFEHTYRYQPVKFAYEPDRDEALLHNPTDFDETNNSQLANLDNLLGPELRSTHSIPTGLA